MAYQYSVSDVLALTQTLVVNDFTAQGETPGSVPFSFAAQQYPLNASNLPLTVIEPKELKVERTDASSRCLILSMKIHHYRKRVAGENAELIAIERLTHLAATMENDPRMSALSPKISIKETNPTGLSTSLEEEATQARQNVTLAHVSLSVNIEWDEFRYAE